MTTKIHVIIWISGKIQNFKYCKKKIIISNLSEKFDSASIALINLSIFAFEINARAASWRNLIRALPDGATRRLIDQSPAD